MTATRHQVGPRARISRVHCNYEQLLSDLRPPQLPRTRRQHRPPATSRRPVTFPGRLDTTRLPPTATATATATSTARHRLAMPPRTARARKPPAKASDDDTTPPKAKKAKAAPKAATATAVGPITADDIAANTVSEGVGEGRAHASPAPAPAPPPASPHPTFAAPPAAERPSGSPIRAPHPPSSSTSPAHQQRRQFCITGALARSRADIENEIKGFGGSVAKSVTAAVTILVCNQSGTKKCLVSAS